MKKAIVVFTKVPKVGEVKTRLTEARGGILTPEEAYNFYESSLLDVIEACIAVEQVDVWVCYNHDGDSAVIDSLLSQVSAPQQITGVFSDRGGSFDDCMQFATDYILKHGAPERLADAVLIVGGDIPTLQPAILEAALNKLENLHQSEAGQKVATKQIKHGDSYIGAALVEGACQEGGFSIVGLTCTTPFDFHKVFYNQDGYTALDMLVDKVKAEKIPFATLEMVPDVDIPVDLASLIPMLRALQASAASDPALLIPKRTLGWLEETGIQSMTLPPERESV